MMMKLMNMPRFSVGRASMLCVGQCRIVLAVERDEHVGAIYAGDGEAENGIDDVFHQAVHDAGEGDADAAIRLRRIGKRAIELSNDFCPRGEAPSSVQSPTHSC